PGLRVGKLFAWLCMSPPARVLNGQAHLTFHHLRVGVYGGYGDRGAPFLLQATQSHQKKISKQSASSHKKTTAEKPYRAGHCFAGPPSSAAQAFNSCSKNSATRDRTLSVNRSLSLLAS